MSLLAAEQQLGYRGASLRLLDHLPKATEQSVLWVLPVFRILKQNLQLNKIYEAETGRRRRERDVYIVQLAIFMNTFTKQETV